MGKLAAGFCLGGLLLLGSCAEKASDNRQGEDRAAQSSEVGSWDKLPKADVGWYRPEGTFWIDDRLVVVAASTIQAWDPGTNKWEVVVDVPQAEECEGCGYSETAVWTGSELLLWGGGFSYRAPDGNRHEGVSVDLKGNIAPLPDAPIPNRWWHNAVWTGSKMIVFGGGRDSHGRRDGAAYDPSTRSWRSIAKSPVGGYANSLVWTGSEMISWGGVKDSTTGVHGYPTGFIAAGAAYDPRTDNWRELRASHLDARGWHSAVWTGSEMIVWGGVARPGGAYAENAGAYDPEAGTWREINAGPLAGRVEHTAVWTGTRMIVFGGGSHQGGSSTDDGAVYDPTSDSWDPLPDPPIKPRYRHTAVWTGKDMIVWGGSDLGEFADGASFRPNPESP